jgi:hypothetical protein
MALHFEEAVWLFHGLSGAEAFFEACEEHAFPGGHFLLALSLANLILALSIWPISLTN